APGASELHDPGQAVDQRVDVGGADPDAVDLDVGVDVRPARVEADRAALVHREVDADVRGQAPRIVERQPGPFQRAGRLLAEERGVVHAHADERGGLRRVGEVVLQRDHRRQVPGAAHLADTADVDVVLERKRRQDLDAQVVAHEVLGGDGRAHAVADFRRGQRAELQRGRVQAAVVRLRIHVVDADAEGPVAPGLGGGGQGGADGGRQQEEGEGLLHRESSLSGVWERGGTAPICACPAPAALIRINRPENRRDRRPAPPRPTGSARLVKSRFPNPFFRESSDMAIKVGINGFGRIGRNVLRAAVQNFGDDIEIGAIYDLLEPEYLAYMLRYDSVHGRFKGEVAVEGSTLIVNGKRIRLTQERDPANLKWDEAGAEVVIESTGLFLDKDSAGKHLAAGAKK